MSSEPMRRFFSLPTVLYGVSPSVKVLSASRRVRQSRISSSVSRLAPEGELALQIGACRQDTADQLGDGFEKLLDGLFGALRGQLRQAGRQAEQFEQRPQNGDVDLLRRFDVLELLEFFEAALGQQVILPESILSPVMAKHDVAGVDEAAQHGHQQVRLQRNFTGWKYSTSVCPFSSSLRFSTWPCPLAFRRLSTSCA
jgi:hypothetical protein